MSLLTQIIAELQKGPPTSQGGPNKGSTEDLEQPVLQQMPVASSGKFSGEIREEEELEESAESEKTAAVEATRRATERAAKIRAALGANQERSPVVIAALRRVAQAKAAREAAKEEAAVELQSKDKPKTVSEVEQGPPGILESREGPNNGLPDEPGCPQQVGVADGWGQLILQQMSTLF